MSVELVLDDEYEFLGNRCSIVPTLLDFGIKICIDNDYTLSNFLEDTDELEKGLTSEISICLNYDYEPLDGTIEDLIKYKNDPEKLINNIEWVRIAFSNTDVKEYIYSHPYLLTKKIILPCNLTVVDYRKASELLEEYAPIKDHIYVLMDNNDNYVKLEDAYNTILKIRTIAEDTLKLGMSPMEEIMYVYDQVRKRIYKQETEEEDNKISRDLTEVLNNDTIVCLGYANIFSAILNYLQINNKVVDLSRKDGYNGHSRNVAYIKDTKYDIDGVYYFDPTFDSQKENNTNKYINTYLHFAKTKKEMEVLDQNIYSDMHFEYYEDNITEEVKEIFDNGDYELLEKNNMVKSINYMSNLVLDKSIINRMNLLPYSPYYGKFDKEQIIAELDYVEDKFAKPITAETYLAILQNVRKLEYYQDEENYPYSIFDLYQVYRRSKWKLSKHYYSPKERLLMVIFGEEFKRDSKDDIAEDFVNYVQIEQEVDKEIEQVKLTKTLSLIKNRK